MTTTTKTPLGVAGTKSVHMRQPEPTDGAVLWKLARDSRSLDLNSPYAYLMWCAEFADSSLVVEVDGEPAGFVMGFRPPKREEVLFVWQVAVAGQHRGLGLASRMLDELAVRAPGVRWLEATVTPSNEASRKLFHSFALRHGCPCSESEYLAAEHFPTPDHESEVLFHIGPIGSEQ